nr:hypothetical protein [Desulfobacula sp.]
MKAVFIYAYEAADPQNTAMVPGSLSSCMVLHTGPEKPGPGKKEAPVLVHDLIQGLLLFQEKKEAGCIIIHPDPETPLDDAAAALLPSGGKSPV